MKINHSFFSNLAFNLAKINLGKTKTNPTVGCIIVKNNSVISSGVTSINGRPHAEFNALNKKKNFSGADMYVTLEPCTHYGITPPCTNIIKKKKIKNVYYVFNDPDKRTFKRAKKILKNKIKKVKLKNSKNKNFYQSYFYNKKENFPFIDAKIAISKDYKTIKKGSKWITNLKSQKLAHFLRSQYDTIISTSVSINKDNSLLNCRINGFDQSKPDLFIIDRNLKLKKNLKLFDITYKRKTYIITSSNDKKKISFFKKKKIKIIKFKQIKNKNDFISIFNKIFKIGQRRILIETGLTFLNKLIDLKLINNLYIFQSNYKLQSNGYNNSKINNLKSLDLSQEILINLNKDKFFKIRLR